MQSRVRMSQIYGQSQATWSQARCLTIIPSGAPDTVGSQLPTQGVCEGLPALARMGAGQVQPSRTGLDSASTGRCPATGSVARGYLDCLVGATVQVALGSHQGPHPVIEARELLLQLQLSAHNVPDL